MLTQRSKLVVKREMSLTERLYLPAIFNGLKITISHLFKRKTTIKYPEETRPVSPIYRGLHVLKRDEAGAERCTACGLCAVACPAEAITMVAEERKPEETHLYREEKYAAIYEIDMLRCIFCGLCEEACPKEAIFLTDRIIPSTYDRDSYVFGKDILVESIEAPVDVTKRQTQEVLEFKKDKKHYHNRTFNDAIKKSGLSGQK
ncbi:MAG: NADH-quinone oxidoreductase subunit NuoI [Saprospiraceae bacterium]|nr:NADH-quinone oxidoreductase subunit NuoI [Saprospiraceae bacterium]